MPSTTSETSQRWLSAGLFLTTFATLLIEILDARLLSVITWYHLSFFAVSLAMLGMAAGAVRVFLGGARYQGDAARAALVTLSWGLAIAIPVSHVVTLVIPLPSFGAAGTMAFVALGVSTLAMTLPFFLSGMVVTIALTRVGGAIGRLYGWDLLGAAAGALIVVPLLERMTLPAAFLIAGAAAAAGTWCFARFAGRANWRAAVAGAAVLLMALAAGTGPDALGVRFSKDRPLPPVADIDQARWNSHSFVVIQKPRPGAPFYWSAGAAATTTPIDQAWMVIDGEAATSLSAWDGDRTSLAWVAHDVTSLPHHLRRGSAAVIGVGGGRDILSALWADHRDVVGIEINRILIDTLTRTHRAFAGVADHPAVTLVHDEARSYLTRTDRRFDVIQMSLIDTWAATGAGAFTLTENGLYTREAWKMFLDALSPTGLFSVSRWFNPSNLSESTRLLGLGVAALLDRGVAAPRAHLVLVARAHVATLMLSPSPLTADDRATLERVAAAEQFDLLVTPWSPAPIDRLERIARSQTMAALTEAVADPELDYSPPTDARPYFFNLLKLSGISDRLPRESIAAGNLGATVTLAALCVIAVGLVAVIILWPLLRAGRPAMPGAMFVSSLLYFALIGTGYMLVQIPFLQRFSVLLGHPTYAFSMVLASMILCTGIGSFLSERLRLDGVLVRWLPLAIAAMLAALSISIGPAVAAGARYDLAGRSLIVLAFTAPLSILLGLAFPIGMRLVGRHAPAATAWMWGVNGACGVVASTLAVATSMWAGIDVNLRVAAGVYALLWVPLWRLRRQD